MKENKEFELIKRFIDGDESAFNQIVQLYREKIYWHARRMTGNHMDADEITQQVLIVLYKKLNTFKFNSSLYTWIYKITSTRSLNLIKKNNLRRFFSFEDVNENETKQENDIVKNIDDKDKLNKLDEILQTLPPKQREIFVLKNFDELSYKEISEITGKSIGTLKANYFHALKKITEKMSDE
ncbi:MAG: RNA polymerase sigma factor [Ignavibacteria bacterium]|nr:MAG: RNA polymerase sigma factor [Ignavibacteria bacterium]